MADSNQQSGRSTSLLSGIEGFDWVAAQLDGCAGDQLKPCDFAPPVDGAQDTADLVADGA